MVGYSRTWSDTVGHGRIQLDMVGYSWTWSDTVGHGRIQLDMVGRGNRRLAKSEMVEKNYHILRVKLGVHS